MGLLKKVVRKGVLPVLTGLGIDRLLLAGKSKSNCIINFHGVCKDLSHRLNNRHMPVREFEKTIQSLKSRYEIVPLSEIFERYNTGKKAAKKTVALTFDDGYLNNFEIAYPILEKYQVPATFYIITRSISGEKDYMVWPDLLDLIRKFHQEDVKIDGMTFKYPAFVNSTGTHLFTYLKTQGLRAEQLVHSIPFDRQRIQDQIQLNPSLYRFVDRPTLTKFKDKSLLEFGSHTHSHPCLEYLKREDVQNELESSTTLLFDVLGKRPVSLAFPDGSYNQQTLEVARTIGFKTLCAVDYKYSEKNSVPDLLSRFTISNSTTSESNLLRLARDFDKYGF